MISEALELHYRLVCDVNADSGECVVTIVHVINHNWFSTFKKSSKDPEFFFGKQMRVLF